MSYDIQKMQHYVNKSGKKAYFTNIVNIEINDLQRKMDFFEHQKICFLRP